MPRRVVAAHVSPEDFAATQLGPSSRVVLEPAGPHWKANGLTGDERRQPPSACGSSAGLPTVMLVAQFASAPRMRQRWAGRSRAAPLPAGGLSLVPAGAPFDWAWDTSVHSLHLWLEPAFLARAASAWWRRAVEPSRCEMREDLQGFHDPHLLHLLRLVRWELHASLTFSDSAVSALRVAELADRVAAHLLGDHSSLARRPADPGWLRRGRLSREQMRTVTERMEAHLREGFSCAPSLDELADLARLDRFWFAKLFRRSLGVAPHQYYAERRLELARTLVHDSPLTLAEIALRVGFADQAHLTRQFRRYFGVAPGQLRRRTRQPSRAIGQERSIQGG